MFLAETGSLGVPSTRATAHFQIRRGCAVVTTLSEFRQRTLACLGNENSNKLVNLWHMLQFNARSFVTLVNDLADLESRARKMCIRDRLGAGLMIRGKASRSFRE